MTEVLLEPFDTLAAWTTAGVTSRTGRTGLGARVTGIGGALSYNIAAGSQSDTVTVGFAFRLSVLSADILGIRGDAGATDHDRINVQPNGSIVVSRAGTGVGSSAAGLIVTNTWYYLELQIKLSDTVGTATVRLNGTTIIGPLTGLDTRNAGTAAVYDQIRFPTADARTLDIDDLYLRTGAAETFRGDTPIGACTSVLREPFENTTAWTASGTTSIVAARTGNGVQLATAAALAYTIPSPSESYEITLGFALKFLSLPTVNGSVIAELSSDSGATVHDTLTWGTGGTLLVRRANTTTLVTTTAPGFVANTWYYLELQLILQDTGGMATVRVDGTQIGTATNVDTRNAGTKTTLDRLRLLGASAASGIVVDDLYLLTGTTCAFLGPQSMGVNAKAWNGSAFVDAPVKVWNGTAFVDAVALKSWNGSVFV